MDPATMIVAGHVRAPRKGIASNSAVMRSRTATAEQSLLSVRDRIDPGIQHIDVIRFIIESEECESSAAAVCHRLGGDQEFHTRG
jgi:hypothetical protein